MASSPRAGVHPAIRGPASSPRAGVLPGRDPAPSPRAGVLPARRDPASSPRAGVLPARRDPAPSPRAGVLPARRDPASSPRAGVLPAMRDPAPSPRAGVRVGRVASPDGMRGDEEPRLRRCPRGATLRASAAPWCWMRPSAPRTRFEAAIPLDSDQQADGLRTRSASVEEDVEQVETEGPCRILCGSSDPPWCGRIGARHGRRATDATRRRLHHPSAGLVTKAQRDGGLAMVVRLRCRPAQPVVPRRRGRDRPCHGLVTDGTVRGRLEHGRRDLDVLVAWYGGCAGGDSDAPMRLADGTPACPKQTSTQGGWRAARNGGPCCGLACREPPSSGVHHQSGSMARV